MKGVRVTGLITILLAIGMFFLGIAGFAGSAPNSLRELCIASFSYWLPTLIIGMLLTFAGKKRNVKASSFKS